MSGPCSAQKTKGCAAASMPICSGFKRRSAGSRHWAPARSRRRRTMKWVTREKVKVDRVACPWLIRKFIDPQAEFLFVPADQVMAVGEREKGDAYHVPGGEYGHHGQECSFDALVEKRRLGREAAPGPPGENVQGAGDGQCH